MLLENTETQEQFLKLVKIIASDPAIDVAANVSPSSKGFSMHKEQTPKSSSSRMTAFGLDEIEKKTWMLEKIVK